MKILVHQSPSTLEPYRTENLGVLCSPRCVYGDDIVGWPWAADNDAFSQWDPGRYSAMLERIREREGCLFVTAPDVVGDAEATLRLYHAWRDELGALPVALVGQDGMTLQSPIPWDELAAFFVGGSTEWKLGTHAAALAREARARGLWVHMGRVNSYERMRYARWIGCHSVDGTGFSWFRDTHLVPHLAALRQLTLEEA